MPAAACRKLYADDPSQRHAKAKILERAHDARLDPEVQALFARLPQRSYDAAGVVAQLPYNPGEAPDAWIATFSDPDDNYFQLVSPM